MGICGGAARRARGAVEEVPLRGSPSGSGIGWFEDDVTLDAGREPSGGRWVPSNGVPISLSHPPVHLRHSASKLVSEADRRIGPTFTVMALTVTPLTVSDRSAGAIVYET